MKTKRAGPPTLSTGRSDGAEKNCVGVNIGVMLTRSDLRGKCGQKGTGRTVTRASEHPMGVGATAGVRSRDNARAKTPHSSTG